MEPRSGAAPARAAAKYAFPPTPGSVRKQREQRAKSLATVRRVVSEIYETERTYVRDLRTLCEEFVYPLSPTAGNGDRGLQGGKARRILSPSQHAALFSNVAQILQLNAKRSRTWGPRHTSARLDDATRPANKPLYDCSPHWRLYLQLVHAFIKCT